MEAALERRDLGRGPGLVEDRTDLGAQGRKMGDQRRRPGSARLSRAFRSQLASPPVR
jgi:hypothetical protein